jgi:hypothetical protein
VIEAVRDIAVRNSVRQAVAFDGLEAASAVEAGD